MSSAALYMYLKEYIPLAHLDLDKKMLLSKPLMLSLAWEPAA
jgi:hypothetical protein